VVPAPWAWAWAWAWAEMVTSVMLADSSGLDILLARPGKAWWRLEGRDPASGLFLSIVGGKRLWWLVAALR
jgi:hypothetical protein